MRVAHRTSKERPFCELYGAFRRPFIPGRNKTGAETRYGVVGSGNEGRSEGDSEGAADAEGSTVGSVVGDFVGFGVADSAGDADSTGEADGDAAALAEADGEGVTGAGSGQLITSPFGVVPCSADALMTMYIDVPSGDSAMPYGKGASVNIGSGFRPGPPERSRRERAEWS